MKKYDPFRIGDLVWSEAYGFGEIVGEDGYNRDITFKNTSGIKELISYEGTLAILRMRNRTFFHAVADTDEGMRAAIARGEGLKRLVHSDRWPIEVGDRVTFVDISYSDYGMVIGYENVNEQTRLVVKMGDIIKYTYRDGRAELSDSVPRFMCLYDGEGIFSSNLRNLNRITDEAIKADWENEIMGNV